MTRVQELLPDERPREKLQSRGAEALTDVELLAILLRTGLKGEPVLEYARRWLAEAGGLEGLAVGPRGQVLKRWGIGPAKQATVAAALEIARRLARTPLLSQPLLDRPEAVGEYLRRRWGHARVEVFGLVTLDARHRLLQEHELHRGARTHSPVEPGEVFAAAIKDNANGVILWHTHPSGDPGPSGDDIDLTRRLAEAGRLLNIAVLDHIIVARSGFVSLRQRGVSFQ